MERSIDTNRLGFSACGINDSLDSVCLDCTGPIDLNRISRFNTDL